MLRRFGSLMFIALVLAACGTPADPPPAAEVTAVEIIEGDQTLVVGEDVELSVTVTAVGGASEDVVWSVVSNPEGAVTVDADGLVEAVAVGTATVTATSDFDSSVSDSITVTVLAGPAVTAVEIIEGDQTLVVGAEVQLSVTVTAVGGASEDVVWSVVSDPEGAVTVDVDGLVRADAAGTATVTATSDFDSSVSDSITVTVMEVGSSFATALLGGTYIDMTNLSVTTPDVTSGTRVVGFDVAWDESWRGFQRPTWVEASDNWDAVWVFVKFSVESGPWQHATLRTSGHTVPSGAVIDTPSDGKGVFIYRDAAGYGRFSAEGVGLVWDSAVDGVDITEDVDLRLFAVEMVYVPEGAFFLGSGGTSVGEFRLGGPMNVPYLVTSQSSITLGEETGQLNWTVDTNTGSPTGTTDADFPTGYAAAYFMKYQLTQGQYVDFLNTLTQAQANTRKYTFAANPIDQYRYEVVGSVVGSYETVFPYLPMNWITWFDGAAYADWAGLRPMTELEYEKAARGTKDTEANEYVWGSTTLVAATALEDAGTRDERPLPADANAVYDGATLREAGEPEVGTVRVGSFAAPGRTRELAGASYYGLLELSGNLFERPVTVGNAEGRSFSGLHGDGELDAGGNATVAGWPGGTNALGAGFRGGTHFTSSAPLLRISARDEASNETAAPNRAGVYGWRGARSAP